MYFEEWGWRMSNASPLVCICIPSYNAAATIRETLASILAQTYTNLVIHVSDNASTDKTLEIVESMPDSRVHVHRHEKNIGGEGNFTRCIQLAAGKYTAIFHADDIYEADMVAKQVAFLESHPDAGAVFTEANMIDEYANIIGAITFPSGLASLGEQISFADIFKSVLRHSNFLICPSAMLRTDIYLNEIKVWRGDLFNTGADLDVWLRVARQHNTGILPERLMRYRISTTQGLQALRERTTRGDFFRVIDHYLAQDEIKAMLAPRDLNNYSRLERTDKAVRAVNLFLQGRQGEAKTLCKEIFVRDALSAAVESRRGFITLLLATYLLFCITLKLNIPGKFLLRKIKLFVRK